MDSWQLSINQAYNGLVRPANVSGAGLSLSHASLTRDGSHGTDGDGATHLQCLLGSGRDLQAGA